MSYELACEIKHETDNAILIHDFATEEDLWIPLSQVDKIVRRKDGTAEVTMSDWIAKQKGLQ